MNKKDTYYFGFNIFNIVFSNDDFYEGILNLLCYINLFFNSESANIYKYNNNCYSSFIGNNSQLNNYVSLSLNHISDKIENSDYFYFPCSNQIIKNILFIPFSLKNDKYILTITNLNNLNNLKNYTLILKQILPVIIGKYYLLEELLKNSFLDGLTMIENRMAYNAKLNEINNNKDKYIYILFDLFRLKYVNDNHGHGKGDEYIIKSVEILKKYFSKFSNEKDINNNISKLNYQSNLYRIGGDEFAVIMKGINIDEMKNRILLAVDEVKNIDLKIDDPEMFLGLNYGIAIRNSFENAEELCLQADKNLSFDKKESYKILGINRRK